jgi:hypothetical protein
MNQEELIKSKNRMVLFNQSYWKGRKQSNEHINLRISNSNKTFKKNHPKILVKCSYCNKNIWRRKSKIRKKFNFCNRKCLSEFMTNFQNLWFTKDKEKKTSMALKGRKLSLEHRLKISKNKRGKGEGKQNPNWRNGISSFYKDYTLKYKKIRDFIRKRDNYKCQVCFKEQYTRQLIVHHIDFNKKNDNKNNLLSVCHVCHRKMHKRKNGH